MFDQIKPDKAERWLPLVFVLLALAVYFPTRDAGYSSDYFGYLDAYKHNEWKDIIRVFHYGSLLYLLHYVSYFLIHYFGPENLGFYLLASALHGLNGFLLLKYAKRLLALCRVEVPLLPAAAALLYILNPYLSEGLTWKACIHYPMVVTFILLALNQYALLLSGGRGRHRILAILFFMLSCFTLEFGMFVPGCFAFMLFLAAWLKKDVALLKREILLTWLPCLLFLILYLFMNKLMLGVFIGHYKAESHLAFGLHSFIYIVKALVKALFFARHLPHEWKMYIFEDFLNRPANAIAVAAVILGGSYLILAKDPVKTALAAFLAASFGLFFIPICNSYFVVLNLFEVDRYIFVSLLFFVMLLLLVLSELPKKLAWALFLIYLAISAVLTGRQVLQIADSGIASTRIMDSGAELYKTSKRFLILNNPDSYDGFWMYTNFTDTIPAMAEGLDLLRGCDPDIRTNRRLLSYVMFSSRDSFSIERVGPNKWKMSMGQWGSWYIKNGVGTTGFENDSMKVEVNSIEALITLKRPMPGLDFWLMNRSEMRKVEGMQYESAGLLQKAE